MSDLDDEADIAVPVAGFDLVVVPVFDRGNKSAPKPTEGDAGGIAMLWMVLLL